MKPLNLIVLFLSFSPLFLTAQNVGISTDQTNPHPSAMLDVQSDDKGLLIPRVALKGLTDVETIQNPATSLLIYNTTETDDLKAGFYFYNGTAWVPITDAQSTELSLTEAQLTFLKAGTTPILDKGAAGQVLTTDGNGGYTWAAPTESATATYWNLLGNAGTTSGTNFVGTIDSQDLDFRTNNILRARMTTQGQLELFTPSNSVFVGPAVGNANTGSANTAIGYRAFFSNTTGGYNNAVGAYTLYSNTTGSCNTAIGTDALFNNTIGDYNYAAGHRVLFNNTTGSFNSATGAYGLYSNTTGSCNTAIGTDALFNNTIGGYNYAAGYRALFSNTTGDKNSATGTYALYSNTTGNQNTANGYQTLYNTTTGGNNSAHGALAMYSNTIGGLNIALGNRALFSNTTGSLNSATGTYALHFNTTGSTNSAAGYSALHQNITGGRNTATGAYSMYTNTHGEQNTANGYQTLMSNNGNANTALGYRAFINGINYNNSTALGANTEITASNQIRLGSNTVTSIGGYANWTNVSDGRFKKNVKEEVPGLTFIQQLRPVTYNLDIEAIAQFNNLPDSMRLAEAEALKAKEIQTGFIAQEVEAAAKKVGYPFSGVDAPKNEQDHYGLRYAEFTVPLVKAVQELAQENDLLIAKNQDQENRLKTLEAELAAIKALLEKTVHPNNK